MAKYREYNSLEWHENSFLVSKANLVLVLSGLRPLLDKPDADKMRTQLRAVVAAFDDFESKEANYFDKLKEIEEAKKKEEES